jgi:hypothetical protein
MRPIPNGAFRHAEDSLLRFADAELAWRGMFPREEGEDRAGLTCLVAVVQVVGAGIVEVDGFLDEPETERAGVEVEVAARGSSDRRHVMNAMGHDRVLRFLFCLGPRVFHADQFLWPISSSTTWRKMQARVAGLHHQARVP